MAESKKEQEKEEFGEENTDCRDNNRYLILHNDDYHTFDYVIDCLVDICKLDDVQAEQCTYIVHFKGKCDIKKGSYDFLRPFKEALSLKGLKVTID